MDLTISTQLQGFIAQAGIDLPELLKSIGAEYYLWDERLSLSTVDYYRLLQELDLRLSDDQLLMFADVAQINAFVPILFAALASNNGATAVTRFAKYKQLLGPVSVVVTATADTTTVHFDFDHPDLELPRFGVLIEQVLLLATIRMGTGRQVAPMRVRSNFDYGAILAGYLDAGAIETGTNALVFRNDDLTLPFATANNVMWQFVAPELNRQLARASGSLDFRDTLQRTLMQAIPSGEFGLNESGRSLGVSGRTLQRRLHTLGTSFQDEVRAVQKMLALNFMADGSLNVSEVGYLVGYADPGSFSRAFKQWTGQSVTGYRKYATRKVNND